MGKIYNYFIDSINAYQRLSTVAGSQANNIYNINFSDLDTRKRYKVSYNLYTRHTTGTGSNSINTNPTILIDFSSNAYQYQMGANSGYANTQLCGSLMPFLTTSNLLVFKSPVSNNGEFMINSPSNFVRVNFLGSGGQFPFSVNRYFMMLSLEEMDE
jgi:hypothetical protein